LVEGETPERPVRPHALSGVCLIVSFGMGQASSSVGELGQRGRRRAARALVEVYSEARLGDLLARVREGIEDDVDDVFAADELLARYGRSRRALAKYCWRRGTGGHVEHVATDLDLDPLGQHPIDWWALGAAGDSE
jgi:hypothetical protein